MAVFWDVTLCSLVETDRRFIQTLMMEAVSSSETSANIYKAARKTVRTWNTT
jgi:hypothetical protein